MATEQQITRLRRDIGATAASLPDPEADAIWAEATELYTDAASIHAGARIIAIRSLLASSAKLVTYRQNASMEQQSDVFKHLRTLLGIWQGELNRVKGPNSTSAGARFVWDVRRYP